MGIVATIPESAVDYVLYGDKSHIVSDYLRSQLSNMPQVFNQFTQRIYGAISESYQYVNDALTRYGILNQLTSQGVIATDDYMRVLSTFEELQQASPVMQRWIMSHPEVRQLYLDQNLDGYSNSYVNVFGNGVKENDYNWRRVMTGVLQDDGETSWRTFYHDDLIAGDRELDHHEKVIALTTYDAMDLILQDNPYDFTLTSDVLMKINRD